MQAPGDLRKIDGDTYDIVPATRSIGHRPGVRRHIRTVDRGHGSLSQLLERFPDAHVSNRVILVAVLAHGPLLVGRELGRELGVDRVVAVFPREVLEAGVAIVLAREPKALLDYFAAISAMPGKIEPWVTAAKM